MKFKKLKHRTITMLPLFLISLSVGALCHPLPKVNYLIDETIEKIEEAQKQMIEGKFTGPEKSLAECKIKHLNIYIESLESNNTSEQSKTISKWTKDITGKLKEIRNQLKKTAHEDEAELDCDTEKEKTLFYEFSKKLKECLRSLKDKNYGAQKR